LQSEVENPAPGTVGSELVNVVNGMTPHEVQGEVVDHSTKLLADVVLRFLVPTPNSEALQHGVEDVLFSF
jgi:hypothetical protein